MAAAQARPSACAAEAERGMLPADIASPMMWMPGTSIDSKLEASTGHQPERSATPACSAMAPAFCGGMTLATSQAWLSKSVVRILADASTAMTLPLDDSGTHSIMLPYNRCQAARKSMRCGKLSFESRIRIFDLGLCCKK